MTISESFPVRSLVLPLVCSLPCLVPGASAQAGPSPASVLLRAPDGSVAGTFGTIEDAVAAAVEGDTIQVPAGTFTGPGNRDLVLSTKNLTIVGAGVGRTILDAEGAARLFHYNGTEIDATSTLADMTLRGGNAFFGGGVLIDAGASPTLRDLEVTGCTATGGGGVFILTGTVSFTRLDVHDNFAQSGGGGISLVLAGGLVTGSFVQRNDTDTAGGGIVISRFPGNDGVPGIRIEDTVVRDNTATGAGGGVYSELADLFTFDRCEISGNSSLSTGGGVTVVGDFLMNATDVGFFQNTLIAQNTAVRGGGIATDSSALVVQNCTIADNDATVATGGFLAGGDGIFLLNTILWGNTSPEPGVQQQQFEVSSVFPPLLLSAYNDVEGGFTDPTSISADPLFQDPENGDYHLGIGSPCINAGFPALQVITSQTDLDGQPRVMSNEVDIGADERVADVRPLRSFR